jgi:glycosyltransferase involved in cell wall biosynthesis
MKGVCFFGAYHAGYPRSRVIQRGLERLGVPVAVCRTDPRRKVATRYPVLAARYLRMRRDFDVVFVPEFRHKDVPLAAALGAFTGKLCVFDPLVSRYDTRIRDRADARENTFQSWHNRNLDAWSMALADLVLADTSAHADYYRSRFAPPDVPIRVLPVGYDDEVFAASGPEPERVGPARVLFFGNYLPLHGADTIVRAAAILRDESVAFELVGGGQTFGDVERIVGSERLSHVTLTPRLPIEELPARIAGASVCLGVFGATEKALRVVPNKVFQCMGVDRAVVTARSPAVLELFRGGDEVALVPPADPGALAAEILRLVRNPGERRRLALAGGKAVRDRFGARKIAERFVWHCERALARRS